MTVPVINAVINFSTGPSFAQAMILDTGILDTKVLRQSAGVIHKLTNFKRAPYPCVLLTKTVILTRKTQPALTFSF